MQFIKNYKDLKDSVKLWLNRRDNATLDNIPMFINFAEKQFTRLVPMPYYEANLEYKVEEGNGTLIIPKNLLKIKHIMVNGQPYNRSDVETFMRMTKSVSSKNSKNEHSVDKDDAIALSNQSGSTSTKSYFFTRIGSILHFTPTPVDGDIIQLIYYQDIPEMKDDEDQPYSLLIAPDVMLYLSLRHASIWLRDNEQEQYWMAKAQEASDSLKSQLDDAEWSGSALVVPYFGE
ncbi:virion structural protein [Cronobacter phage vB_CsaP_009]|uniref:Uncharacterized protein n=1 Tax=Cronobacter phage vB_CsaP_009 TaxID=2699738 RepID=A0A679FC34_9CAUD|nr:virion structural protein [Cronobacter phage vB_CsaP_009]BBU72724.1 hypothetical protein [Cronobacter phage vB_CsaP_009]